MATGQQEERLTSSKEPMIKVLATLPVYTPYTAVIFHQAHGPTSSESLPKQIAPTNLAAQPPLPPTIPSVPTSTGTAEATLPSEEKHDLAIGALESTSGPSPLPPPPYPLLSLHSPTESQHPSTSSPTATQPATTEANSTSGVHHQHSSPTLPTLRPHQHLSLEETVPYAR